MRVAYVLPRYGEEIVGGAEYAARIFAERLVHLTGWDVEVFTTCAVDHLTWADELPPGDSDLNGVTVHRFPCRPSRLDAEPEFVRRVFDDPAGTSMADAERWIDLQGPTSPELLDALGDAVADLAVFKPYLLHPTVRGVHRVSCPSVMHPAAHDEPALRLPVFDPVFAATGGFVHNTHEERRLVERRFRVAEHPAIVLGLGVDAPPDDELETLPRPAIDGLDDRPYLMAIGRVESGKGTVLLARYFSEYKRRHPGPLALLLVGPSRDQTPFEHPDVVLTGVVDEDTKWRAIRHATALAAPAPYESFCMAVTEAWAARVPVIVNGACPVTVGHCRRSGGGLWFDDYPSFEAVVDRLTGSEELRARLGERGRHYVDRHYRWPYLMERYRDFFREMANRT